MEIGFAVPNIGPLAREETVLRIADRAEELGIDALWIGDHLALPSRRRVPYPYYRDKPGYHDPKAPILDPFITGAVIAGRTRKVRVGFGVLVLPYRHPLVTAKMIATLDVLSAGRLIVAVGVGWLREEFDALGVDISKRGAMTDEQIRYLKEVWSKDEPHFRGASYRFDGLTLYPKPLAGSVPIWVGGNSSPAMRRAARLGDGLHFIDLSLTELQAHLHELELICSEVGRPMQELTISMRSGLRITAYEATDDERSSPITGSIDQIVDDLRRLETHGVDHVCLGPAAQADTLESYLAVLDVVGREIAPALRR